MSKIKIVQRKLGGHKAKGRYLAGKNMSVIEIDPTQDAKEELDTLTHEALHHTFPFLDEPATEKASRDITEILWTYGYRKVRQ